MNTIKNAPLALVTGASRGIGRAIAAALAEAGYHLILTCSHTLPDLQEVAACLEEKYGITCTAMAADASEPAAIEKEFLDKKNRAFAVQKRGIYREPLAYPLFKAPFSWLRQADIKAYWHSAF